MIITPIKLGGHSLVLKGQKIMERWFICYGMNSASDSCNCDGNRDENNVSCYFFFIIIIFYIII